ncbi:MAG: peroxidase-related enzyme [Cyanobacteria bacterium J06626_18]
MPFLSPQTLPDIFRQDLSRYAALVQFLQSVMRGESAFSPGERELIAAYVSGLNACDYCHGAHQAIATDLGIDSQLLEAMLQDLDTAPVGDRFRAVLALVQKLTLTPSKVTQGDIDAVAQAGWSERAIQDAIEVCALFSFMNRIVNGYGFETPDGQQMAAMAKGINTHGYEAPLTMKAE